MIQDILQDKLVQAGLVIPGESFFLEFMPSSVQVGVLLRTPLEGIGVDQETPGYHRCRFQFITRHTDPVDGARMAAEVQNILLMNGSERYAATAERGRVNITLFYPATLPIRFPSLEGDGIEFSQHFNAAFSVTNQ